MDSFIFAWTVYAVIIHSFATALPDTPRPPAFSQEPSSPIVFWSVTGSVVECGAEGRPTPTLRWVGPDGRGAVNMPGLRHVRQDGALVFPPFTAGAYRADVHAALYRCEASNSVGVVGSRDVHVRAVVSQHYEIRLTDQLALSGNIAILHCPLPSSVSDYVTVTSWERMDGFIITPGIISGKYGMLHDGELYIRDVNGQDSSYSYRCHVENKVTREKKSSINFSKLSVTEPRHNQPPRMVHPLTQDIIAKVGERVTLSCIAEGNPAPNYRWHKVAGELRTIPDLGSSVRQEGGLLVFQSVVSADSGIYICDVSNGIGQDRVEKKLFVQEPLQVSIFPPQLQLEVGVTAVFNCSVRGGPVTTVSWRKDMRSLTANPRAIFPTPTTLHVQHISRKDAGIYQCFVSRGQDTAQASALLAIGDLVPKLKGTFPEKIVRPGSHVSLCCVSSGNPPPQISWLLDGTWPVRSRPGVSVSTHLDSSGDVVSFLNFTSVEVSDSGMYQCTAFNDVGRASHSNRLNVFGSLFVRPIGNVTALADSPFSVSCPFGGFPFDGITWKKEGRHLPLIDRQKIFPNGTLHIAGVQQRGDGGWYSCEVASGQSLPVTRTFRLIVRTGPKVSSFSFKDDLHEGMLTAVTCIVDAGDGPLTTRWLKDGEVLQERDLNAVVIYAQEGYVSTLTMRDLGHQHNGNYTCSATNDVATGSFSAALVVKVPPRWVLEPKDVSAVSGRPVKIGCQVDGVPPPHIRWRKSSGHSSEQFETIVSSSHVHILVNGSLNFPSAEASDAGRYMCEANNGVGDGLSAVVSLIVNSPPHFQLKFRVLSSRRGEKTVLDCNSFGNTPITFVWRRQGVVIEDNSESRYRMTRESRTDGERSKLIIDRVERKDSALFTCTAFNDYGEDTLSLQLTVQDIPDAPQNLEIHDVSSRGVRLTWDRPFDGNAPLLRYTVVWRTPSGDVTGGPITVPGTETTLLIRKLRPRTRYFFRVKCHNSLGDSQYGAEVAASTLEEPPTRSPEDVRAFVLSSRAINVTWLVPVEEEEENIQGFYIGHKVFGSVSAYTFKPVEVMAGRFQHFVMSNLDRFTEYSFVVQLYNARGAGPTSQQVIARTLEFDPPGIPMIKTYYATSNSIKLSWELNVLPSAPVTGYILHYRLEEQHWQETTLSGDQTAYTLKNLQCGSAYYIFLLAFNSVSEGNSSEIVSAKTNGNAPIAPDKRMLLTVNKTTVTVNLNSWHNGGCPINFFVIQYRLSGQAEWTLVSNNIIPAQQNITITDLSSGGWYSLLMTARNDAGATDAEYLFATLTPLGEIPPLPSEMGDLNGSFYRHLTITVPVASCVVVLAAVFAVICFVTRRRTSNRGPCNSPGNISQEPVKPDGMSLSVTYDSTQEPAYYPSPYSDANTPGYSREHCLLTRNQQSMGTFGNARCYTYDIPYPQRRDEKRQSNYDSSIVYLPAYNRTGPHLRNQQSIAIYEIPNLGRRKQDNSRSWHETGDGDSSEGCGDESPKEPAEEARESEAECDRPWKAFMCNEYGGNIRWPLDGGRVLLT